MSSSTFIKFKYIKWLRNNQILHTYFATPGAMPWSEIVVNESLVNDISADKLEPIILTFRSFLNKQEANPHRKTK